MIRDHALPKEGAEPNLAASEPGDTLAERLKTACGKSVAASHMKRHKCG